MIQKQETRLLAFNTRTITDLKMGMLTVMRLYAVLRTNKDWILIKNPAVITFISGLQENKY
ncbi:MAG TPA: hypothetical protein DD733_10205 [Clostridiales bacterium]|nr:hypothetical protein [Clostridiales bacterium]